MVNELAGGNIKGQVSQEQEQPQPFYCLFQPVAASMCPSLLDFKLKKQLRIQQSQLSQVPPVPLSSSKAIKGPATHWLPSYIKDILYIEMCEAQKVQVDNPFGGGDTKYKYTYDDDKISKYYIEAAKYAGRISWGDLDENENQKHKPVFEINPNDFSPRLQAELMLLFKTSPDTLRRVVQNAVFRIFKANGVNCISPLQ